MLLLCPHLAFSTRSARANPAAISLQYQFQSTQAAVLALRSDN